MNWNGRSGNDTQASGLKQRGPPTLWRSPSSRLGGGAHRIWIGINLVLTVSYTKKAYGGPVALLKADMDGDVSRWGEALILVGSEVFLSEGHRSIARY
jgi:hypothetical protein